MKAVIYARESSADTKKAPPIADQIERATAWIKENNHELVHVYADNGYSGGNWKRPDWLQAMKDAKRHTYTLLVTWDQDRLARDTEQFLFFYRKLKGSNAQVHSIIEGAIEMNTAGDRIKHTTLAVASETFRLITSEKVRNTYAYKKQKAQETGIPLKWGRPASELDVDLLLKLRRIGLGYRKIAEKYYELTCNRDTPYKSCKYNYQTIRRALLKHDEGVRK